MERKFNEEDTIILFFDFEFYVPDGDRQIKGFKSNPYKDGHFLIGGTFICNYPLLENKKNDTKRFWIWNYNNEKEMLLEILNYIKSLWHKIADGEFRQELVVCGIGIGRIDIPYFFGRCHQNNIDSDSNLFYYINRLRIIDLENVTILLYKNKRDFLYTKSTDEINEHLLGFLEKRKPGTLLWDYYDKKDFKLIIERNEKEVYDQFEVYKTMLKYIKSKYVRNSYLKDTFHEILNEIGNEDEKEIITENYLLNNSKSHYILREIDFDNKSKFSNHIKLKLRIMEIMEKAYDLLQMKKSNGT
jgi:hypothetical protein